MLPLLPCFSAIFLSLYYFLSPCSLTILSRTIYSPLPQKTHQKSHKPLLPSHPQPQLLYLLSRLKGPSPTLPPHYNSHQNLFPFALPQWDPRTPTSVTVHPPKPPPVILEPKTPGTSSAEETSWSSSGHDTS